MSALPANWVDIKLSEVAQVTSGIGFPNEYQGHTSGDLPFFKVSDISHAVLANRGELKTANHYVTYEIAEKLKGKPLVPGSTVFAKIGEAVRLNRRATAVTPCLIDNNVMAVKAMEGVNDRYVHQFLRTVDFGESARSTTVPSLRKGDVEELRFPLAPAVEQKRIADKLDAVLTRVDAVNTRLVRVAPLLKRFRQSVLAAAFTGRLTNVAATALPSSWQTVTLGSLITHGPKNGLYKPSSAYGDGVRILRIDSFYDGKVSDWGGLRLLSVDSSELKQFGLKNGDIVINRVNSIEYLGKCALIEGLQGECVFESNMMKFRLSSELANPHFVRAWLCSEDARTQIVGKAKHAVNQASINQSDVCSLKLQLPPLSEQTEIVRRVETLFALADRLEARLAQAQTAATRLTPALLAKAFRGELVPQDPNDEPAAELLRRLQQKASSNSEKRRRKSST